MGLGARLQCRGLVVAAAEVYVHTIRLPPVMPSTGRSVIQIKGIRRRLRHTAVTRHGEPSVRLTKFTDYALRVLLYAASRPEQLVTIEETARAFEVSRAHLKKVVLLLSSAGYLRAVRGRRGGFTLGRAPDDINIGAVLRLTEPDFGLMECFLPDNACPISHLCKLPHVVNEALAAFIETFDQYTLRDVMLTPEDFMRAAPGERPRRGPELPRREAAE